MEVSVVRSYNCFKIQSKAKFACPMLYIGGYTYLTGKKYRVQTILTTTQ